MKTESKRGKPVKAVIDTNVLVSGLFAGSGSISDLMDLWYDGQFDLIISEEILSELFRVFHKPSVQKHFNPSEDDINEFLDNIREKAIITPGNYQTDRIKKDPTDNKFLSCAVEGGADFIVSGDKHLKEIKQFKSIKIIDAKAFVQKLRKGRKK